MRDPSGDERRSIAPSLLCALSHHTDARYASNARPSATVRRSGLSGKQADVQISAIRRPVVQPIRSFAHLRSAVRRGVIADAAQNDARLPSVQSMQKDSAASFQDQAWRALAQTFNAILAPLCAKPPRRTTLRPTIAPPDRCAAPPPWRRRRSGWRAPCGSRRSAPRRGA